MREKKRPKFRNEKRLLNFGRKREKSLGVVSWNINSTVGALQGMKRGRESKGCELYSMGITHRVISDRVHRLLVTLSYFRPDRFVQLLSLIPILILLLYYLVSGCLTSLC